jgi:hypothetical protein
MVVVKREDGDQLASNHQQNDVRARTIHVLIGGLVFAIAFASHRLNSYRVAVDFPIGTGIYVSGVLFLCFE